MSIAVCGIGIVSAIGIGAGETLGNLRTGRSTHIGNTLQKGIQARFHQSGTMHRLPLHNAFSPLRAQLSGVMSTPSLQPMRCQ